MIAAEVEALLLAEDLDAEAASALGRYAALLERWGRVHNLVRFSGPEELVRRHLLDGVAAAPLLPEGPRLLDVGSGAGLPGVPLLVAKPGSRGVLLEPRHKRHAFLKLVIAELGLDVEAEAERFEEHAGGPYDAVCARAVGRHEELLEWSRDHLTPGGRVLLWLGDEDRRRLARQPGWRVLPSTIALATGSVVAYETCST